MGLGGPISARINKWASEGPPPPAILKNGKKTFSGGTLCPCTFQCFIQLILREVTLAEHSSWMNVKPNPCTICRIMIKKLSQSVFFWLIVSSIKPLILELTALL